MPVTTNQSVTTNESFTIHDIPINELTKTKKIEYTQDESTVIDIFKSNEKKISDYNCNDRIIKLLNEFFGDTNTLYKNGLVIQYNKLKDKVITKNLIGHILYGMNQTDKLINNYTTPNYETIQLTVSNICRHLLREYFTKEEINTCCDNIINYDMVFN